VHSTKKKKLFACLPVGAVLNIVIMRRNDKTRAKLLLLLLDLAILPLPTSFQLFVINWLEGTLILVYTSIYEEFMYIGRIMHGDNLVPRYGIGFGDESRLIYFNSQVATYINWIFFCIGCSSIIWCLLLAMTFQNNTTTPAPSHLLYKNPTYT